MVNTDLIFGIGTFIVTLCLLGLVFHNTHDESQTSTFVTPETDAVINNDVVIYSPQVFESLFRDLITVVINNQEQQSAQFKIVQAQIDFINNVLFYSALGIFTLIVGGLGFYFLYNNPNINMPEIGNNIYTQIYNQYTYITNQTQQIFNRMLRPFNVDIPIAHAELVNQNNPQYDNRVLDILAENVANTIQDQEIERLFDLLLNDRVLDYVTNVANVDLIDAHIIGQMLLQNNGLI